MSKNIIIEPSVSNERVYEATGKQWDEWFSTLEQVNASKKTHKEIAAMLYEEYGTTAWWAQTITVDYERFIGRREVGQSCEGDFQAGASKTLLANIDEVLDSWLDYIKGKNSLNDVPYAEAPSIRKTEKWRYWRVPLEDGSKVNINITQKAPGKTGLSVNHEKLNDTDAVDNWKQFWKGCFKEFAEQL